MVVGRCWLELSDINQTTQRWKLQAFERTFWKDASDRGALEQDFDGLVCQVANFHSDVVVAYFGYFAKHAASRNDLVTFCQCSNQISMFFLAFHLWPYH